VVVGPPPAKCVGNGPPIILTTGGDGGGTSSCSGNTAASTFPWAICTCNGFTGGGSQNFDAFDSTKAPYTPGGLGAGVGVNGTYDGGSSLTCTGDLWSLGAIDPGNATVRQELHVGGALDGAVTVSRTSYATGPFIGSGSFAQDLYTPTCPPPGGYTVGGTCHPTPGLTIPTPCKRCDPVDQVPVSAYISYYAQAAHNDNAAIGLSASVFDNGGAAAVLDLPCGYYYLNRIVANSGLTIVAHGNTALFIGGSIEVSGSLVLSLDPGARFDILVGGDIYGNGTLSIGSPAYPANTRVYVGGVCKAGGASCGHKGECCSATCTGGTCGAGTVVSGDPPWSVYLKASANLAAGVYAPNGEIYASASFTMYGAIFAGYYHGKASTTIHYDTAAAKAGQGCPPPTAGSCLDCGNQALSAATRRLHVSSQCCALQCVNRVRTWRSNRQRRSGIDGQRAVPAR
jgi:hypothetical protein